MDLMVKIYCDKMVLQPNADLGINFFGVLGIKKCMIPIKKYGLTFMYGKKLGTIFSRMAISRKFLNFLQVDREKRIAHLFVVFSVRLIKKCVGYSLLLPFL